LIKLLLKFPVPGIPFFIVRRLPSLEGIVHGLFLPIFTLLIGLFTLWLIPTSTLLLGFPLNIILTLTVPGLIFAIYIRIELERSINWWRGAFGSQTQRDTSKAVEELVELFKEQQNKKSSRQLKS
jgi:hypothetical protein